MLGRSLERLVPEAPAPRAGEPVIEVRELSGRRLVGLSVAVHPGEIVGVTGLLGSGKTELGRLLSGAERPTGGTIRVHGSVVSFRHPKDSIGEGIGYVPPERRTQGGLPTLSAFENVSLPDLRRFFGRGWLDEQAEKRETLAWMDTTGAIPRDPSRLFATFSGGNQQKLVFAKWFRLRPRVLVLDEPTQGVDVGAVQDLYGLIRGAAAEGVAVVLLSSEWDDMARICHRSLILDRGRMVADLRGPRTPPITSRPQRSRLGRSRMAQPDDSGVAVTSADRPTSGTPGRVFEAVWGGARARRSGRGLLDPAAPILPHVPEPQDALGDPGRARHPRHRCTGAAGCGRIRPLRGFQSGSGRDDGGSAHRQARSRCPRGGAGRPRASRRSSAWSTACSWCVSRSAPSSRRSAWAACWQA